ncbi:Pimeloyl-ACP methyl ester carboxylesterase [Pedococcus dokdonensis]|uniref:Pimeloyl-ACP methyl ester carboxylesterase n=1 Tax=Pedococcus dokdonensis TaxID=443156 RepID=A0A1H0R5S5_9MICO|nr:alpha/beta hydrolase [Pedococcus dokdonensis]SDP24892.1 Pimeloyl-ACP methyl ester carboxylesterase [Pedococcus dokdonensis]
MPPALDAPDATELAYRWSGPADPATPTVVLLHGLGDSGDCWPDAVRRWSPRWRVVGVDLLGHGRSPRFTREQLSAADPMEAMYAAAEATVARVASGRGGPVLVVGHSMGGGMAGALAARRPDLVAAAVLEDPAWRDPAERVQPRGIVHERVAECRAFADDPAGQLDKGRADNPTWPEVELAPWVESKAQVDLDFLDLGIANLLEPWDEIVTAIGVPTLVLLAERGGPVTPAVRARAAGLANPQVQIRVVEGAGHCIRRDRAEDFHAVVDRFLDEHRVAAPGERVTP